MGLNSELIFLRKTPVDWGELSRDLGEQGLVWTVYGKGLENK